MKKNGFEIIDENTYQEIQKLTEYVSFVANLPYTTDEDKSKLKEILDLIGQINNPNTHKNWWACIDIYDEDVQLNKISGNFYWRKCFAAFQNGTLEIVTESNYINDEDTAVRPKHFEYYGAVYFEDTITGKRSYLKQDVFEFVEDAKNYKKYLTEARMTVEAELDIW